MDRTFGISVLKAVNEWRDEILIEASTILLIIGFVMGTVDIFVGGGIATSLWFKVSWAVVQALAIDGLFFAVWGKVAKAQWTRANLRRNIPLVAVGLVLALVAALVNDILTYQQINGIADSLLAIKRLGIDVQAFTTARAVLVVGVGVLVQLFCRGSIEEIGVTTVLEEVDLVQVSVQQPALQVNGTVVPERGTAPVQVAIPERAELRTRVLELAQQENKTRRAIAQEVGVPLSTVQSWIKGASDD